ncbi:unnamed protein product [Pleuronectes platessa]|uniref:Uncharacterized protein n=1 Tax=Pleuronectes platessa TaxID=8262 RepID=A0A9N7Z5D3_PLEPL|nr:unnamed protein product [Pleuronectes platessa]
MRAAGARRWGSTDGEQAGRGSPVKWVGMSLALCIRGTCRCRCSSSKSFYQLSGREVMRNSFGITHLHHAFQQQSVNVQGWSRVGRGWQPEPEELTRGLNWAAGKGAITCVSMTAHSLITPADS